VCSPAGRQNVFFAQNGCVTFDEQPNPLIGICDDTIANDDAFARFELILRDILPFPAAGLLTEKDAARSDRPGRLKIESYSGFVGVFARRAIGARLVGVSRGVGWNASIGPKAEIDNELLGWNRSLMARASWTFCCARNAILSGAAT